MKTILMWLLGIVIFCIICLTVGFIGCLCKGTMGFRNGSLVALDPNGQIIEPLPWNEGWCNSTNKPTEEEIVAIDQKYQEGRSEKAANYCFMALGAFILGWITGKAQFHTVGILFLFGGLIYDYKMVTTALFLWYFIVPALVIGAIIGLFKRN